MANIPRPLLKHSGLTVMKGPDGKDLLVPDKLDDIIAKDQDPSSNKLTGGISIKSSTDVYKLFEYYIYSVLETNVAIRNKRYEQMDFILENDPALSMTRGLLVDEMFQADVFREPITVIAKTARVKKLIVKLFKDLGVKQLLKDIALSLVTYGDAFLLMDLDKSKGITKLIPVDPRDVRHRFEFSIAELRKNRQRYVRRFPNMKKLIDLASSASTSASDFNKILLGFQVIDTLFPLWQVLHFRNFTTRKEIYPFGKPFFYDAQSAVRMYLNGKVVVNMMRSSAFMKEVIKVKTPPNADPVEKWQTVSMVKQQMELFNLLGGRASKDYPSFGDKLYIPEDMVTIEKLESGINIRDRFEDLDMLRDDVYTSTGLPREYFEGRTANGVYQSSKAIVSQDKKAARKVYGLQTVIIDQLIKLVEVHFSYSKEFDPYTESFAISLPYPVLDMDDTKLNLDNQKIAFAIATMDQLKNSLGLTKVPEDIVRKLLGQFFPLTSPEVSMVIDQMHKDMEHELSIGFDRKGLTAGDPFLQNKTLQDLNIGVQLQQQGDAAQPAQAVPAEGQQAQAGAQQAAPQPQQQVAGYITPLPSLEEVGPSVYLEALKKHQTDKTALQEISDISSSIKLEEQIRKDIQTLKTLNEEKLEESFIVSRDRTILEDGSSEFVFNQQHFVVNNYSSQDRNIHLVEDKTPEQRHELLTSIQEGKVVSEERKSKKVAVVEEDTIQDRRFLKKEELIEIRKEGT